MNPSEILTFMETLSFILEVSGAQSRDGRCVYKPSLFSPLGLCTFHASDLVLNRDFVLIKMIINDNKAF